MKRETAAGRENVSEVIPENIWLFASLPDDVSISQPQQARIVYFSVALIMAMILLLLVISI